MAFLNENDYKIFIKGVTLQAVTDAGEAEIGICENIAQEEITSYLRTRYDMAVAFGKSGADRYPLLIMYMVDITLFHLHSRIAGRQVPETRVNRYNIAKDWLERAAAGKVTVEWQAVVDTTGEAKNDFRFKSHPKFNSVDY